ncbi:PREDICTED: helicase-like transcription factor CHR28 [Ipomoea nil]|uniref:helicase-like transcription factor CHR28 n=1 Tax=Ipomoea nil TaxID=35883 RepID=UPI0009008696|nr:PREDICTED: helicase-like transcription factor CHR28 [Ipomoea nil]
MGFKLKTYVVICCDDSSEDDEDEAKQPAVEDDDDEQKNGERYGLSSQFSNYKKLKNTYVKKKGKKGRNGIDTDDFDPSCGTLARVSWFRVILDEAQTIKNHTTQVARACCSLRAKRRWCLSGTPIQNSIDELFSYFRFLRHDPYADYKTFCSGVKYPIAMNLIQGYKKLQAILRAIMLLRTKGTLIEGQPIINLPPKTIHLKKVAFSAEERDFYNRLEAASRSQFKVPFYFPVHVLKCECCAKLLNFTIVFPLFLIDMKDRDPPKYAVVTLCKHVFCYQCVSEYLTGEDNTCPTHGCKKQLHADIVFSEAVLKRCTSDNLDKDPLNLSVYDDKSIMGKKYCSSKIRACLEILNSFCKLEDSSSDSDILVQSNGETSSIENKNSVPHSVDGHVGPS